MLVAVHHQPQHRASLKLVGHAQEFEAKKRAQEACTVAMLSTFAGYQLPPLCCDAMSSGFLCYDWHSG